MTTRKPIIYKKERVKWWTFPWNRAEEDPNRNGGWIYGKYHWGNKIE